MNKPHGLWSLPRTAAVFVVWTVFGSALLFVPGGFIVAALLAYWLLAGFFIGRGRPGELRRWAALRLRPLKGEVLLWTLAAVPLLWALTWALTTVYTGVVPVPIENFYPFEGYTDTPQQRLPIVVLAVGLAPLVEELTFRGVLLYRLERRYGVAAAIVVSSLVFALIHLLPWVLPVHFALGICFAWMVYATRSLWAGIVLHVANNAVAVLSLREPPQPAGPTIWQTGVTTEWLMSLGALILTVALAIWLGRQVWQVGHSRATTKPSQPPPLLGASA